VRDPGYQGAIEYIDVSNFNGRPSIQINLTRNGGTVISQVVVSQSPVFLLLNNNGVYHYRYRALE
jgi:hypothetical protein